MAASAVAEHSCQNTGDSKISLVKLVKKSPALMVSISCTSHVVLPVSKALWKSSRALQLLVVTCLNFWRLFVVNKSKQTFKNKKYIHYFLHDEVENYCNMTGP